MRAIKTEIIDQRFADNLRDESRFTGTAEKIAFPENQEDIKELIKTAKENRVGLTVQGGRTGICGGAVPMGGIIVDMSKMNKIGSIYKSSKGEYLIDVQAGATIEDLNKVIRKESKNTLFWPPEPSEKSASIGGAFACNTAGMNKIKYGSAKNYIEGLNFITSTGELWEIKKGQFIFDEKGCKLPNGNYLELEYRDEDQRISFLTREKSMDLVEFLSGSEGCLGIASDFTLRLLKKPEIQWGIVFLFSSLEKGLSFIDTLEENKEAEEFINAFEFYDEGSLSLLRENSTYMADLKKLPEIGKDKKCAFYIELSAEEVNAQGMEETLMFAMEAFESSGGMEEDTWAGEDESEIEIFRKMRHAVPECANMRIDKLRLDYPTLCKTSPDISFKDGTYREIVETYKEILDKTQIDYILFGHLAAKHLHVDLFPKNKEESEKLKPFIDELSEKAIDQGGSIAAENGVGKAKGYIERHIDETLFKKLENVKKTFDPDEIFNPGNMVYKKYVI